MALVAFIRALQSMCGSRVKLCQLLFGCLYLGQSAVGVLVDM